MIASALLGLWLGVARAEPAVQPDPPEPAEPREQPVVVPTPPLVSVVAPPPAEWEARRWRRGRRVSTSGLFLGWAGMGLAAGGATLAASGRDTGPLTSREVLASTVSVGGGIAVLGLVLQVTGASEQRRAMPASLRPHRARNLVAAGLAGVGAAACGVLAWRLLDEDPDGLWIVGAAPLAIGGTLGATGLHTITLIEGDVLAREGGLRASFGPGFVRLEGRF